MVVSGGHGEACGDGRSDDVGVVVMMASGGQDELGEVLSVLVVLI